MNSRNQVKDVGDYAIQLSLTELQEIEDAVAHFESLSLPLNRIQAETFPLPTLGKRLRERSMLLHNDKTFFMLRGLKPNWFSKLKNVILYLGVASHVATKRACAKGDPTVLHHVTNMQVPDGDEEKTYRGPGNRNIALPFHNDFGEIVSLYSLSCPASGGDFFLADIEDVAEKLRCTDSSILATLRENFTMGCPGADCGYEERPLLFDTPSNGLVLQASRSRLCNSFRPRPGSIGELSEAQIRALDALHTVGQEVAHRIVFRAGDMLFFNNMRMMHARDGFVDGSEAENTTQRYLLRLILKDERNGGWEVPEAMEKTWRELYAHEDAEEVVPVHPTLFSFKAGH